MRNLLTTSIHCIVALTFTSSISSLTDKQPDSCQKGKYLQYLTLKSQTILDGPVRPNNILLTPQWAHNNCLIDTDLSWEENQNYLQLCDKYLQDFQPCDEALRVVIMIGEFRWKWHVDIRVISSSYLNRVPWFGRIDQSNAGPPETSRSIRDYLRLSIDLSTAERLFSK